MTNQSYLNRTQAAEFIREQGLPCAKTTLQKLATIGGGPTYRRFGGRVVYTEGDLQNWVSARMSKPLSHSGEA